ncbi:MAG TPA: O-antigen ligase family protein [Bryobacteraceae bacterium]|jgi:O-antigen ligase|nr:O-antigen ligase family protein [Bryobacteraceae bacterium]
MLPGTEARGRILLITAIAAAGLIQISIAASQIFLGLGIALLLVFERRLPFPRIWIPLAALLFWTMLADLLDPDPWLGRAQIKKFFVFLFIPLIYSVFREQLERLFYLVAVWAAGAAVSSGIAVFQYLRHAHESYIAYVGQRITGFESHWMTFGALELSVLLILVAHWCFASRRLPVWAYLSAVLLAAAILLGGTRSIWLAAIPSLLYLVWVWRPKMIFAVPLLAAIAFLAAPHNVKTRVLSTVHPNENIDSNRFRQVTFRTGLEMIKAHPWFGVGPEEIRRNFDAYVPSDVKRPLPSGFYGHLHNIYVQYAAERGIPGLLCVLWFIGLAAYDFTRALFRIGQARSQQLFILHAALAVIIAILIEGAFEYNLGDSEVLMMFVTILALGYAAISPRAFTSACEYKSARYTS